MELIKTKNIQLINKIFNVQSHNHSSKVLNKYASKFEERAETSSI